MLTQRNLLLAAVFGLSMMLAIAPADATVTKNFNLGGTTFSTAAITSSTTDGAAMDGMSVTAFFADATTQNLTWADTGATSGGVTGTGWSLNVSGDTFSAVWNLVNNRGVAMTGFSLVGSPVTVFDTTFGNAFGTTGSVNGRDFVESAPLISGLAIDVTYSGALGLGAAAPVGDLFVRLDALFTNQGGLANGQTLRFIQDTDNGTTDIIIGPPPVGPVAASSTINVFVGDPVNYTFTATDTDNAQSELTWSFGGLIPPGFTAPTFNPSTQQFFWDTAGSSLGTYQARATVTDPSNLSDTGVLTINVLQRPVDPEAVPEPSTFVLAGLGLAGVGLVAWRRRARR